MRSTAVTKEKNVGLRQKITTMTVGKGVWIMSTIIQLEQWLKENIEYEDYCIENNLSNSAPIQRACWYSVLMKIGEPWQPAKASA